MYVIVLSRALGLLLIRQSYRGQAGFSVLEGEIVYRNSLVRQIFVVVWELSRSSSGACNSHESQLACLSWANLQSRSSDKQLWVRDVA